MLCFDRLRVPGMRVHSIWGQLICLACYAIFLFRGEDRYYSPILNEFVTLVENKTPYQED